MKFGILNAIIFVTFFGKAFSQSDSSAYARNILYIEAFGPGGYGSVDYERIFLIKKQFTFSARLGLGIYHLNDFTLKINPDIIIPIGINGNYGEVHKTEFGIGQTISSIVQADETDLSPARSTNFSTFFLLGYRYQKQAGPLFFRLAFTPLIENNKTWRNWGGISFGFVF